MSAGLVASRSICIQRRARTCAAVIALLASIAAMGAAATASAQPQPLVRSGTHPWVIALCHFSNQAAPTPFDGGPGETYAYTRDYFRHMFTEAGSGELGMFDYWRDVSLKQLSVAGTFVSEWALARRPVTREVLTRDQWGALSRPDRTRACAEGVRDQVDFSRYWGVAAMFPEARMATTAAIDATQTTVDVARNAHFAWLPTPPFRMTLGDPPIPGRPDRVIEVVDVTAINGLTLTIVRGQGGTTAVPQDAGELASVPGDLGASGVGQVPVVLSDPNKPGSARTYDLASIILPHDIAPATTAHEQGHGLGWRGDGHARKLSKPMEAYGACYDIMSQGCGEFTAGTKFGITGGVEKGPSVNAINMELQGWIPAGRIHHVDNATPTAQDTITLHALSDPDARDADPSQKLVAHIPAVKEIAAESTFTTDYYTVEYHEKAGWDRGFPDDSVVLYLHSGSGPTDQSALTFWVDQTPDGTPAGHAGLLYPGDSYGDAASKTYVAVNSKNRATHTAQVTIGSEKLKAELSIAAPASGQFSDRVSYSVFLKTQGGAAPVPNAFVTSLIGNAGCKGATDATGELKCVSPRLAQHPGAYAISATYDGDAAYDSASASVPFEITREDTTLTYSGPSTSDYHDAFTARGRLDDPDQTGGFIAGRTVTFTLGTSDSCSAVTDADGLATCPITPDQKPGTVDIVASFAGDVDYRPSSATQPFEITKQETVTTHDVPTHAANDFPLALKGTLKEETQAPVEGRTLTFTLGSGASAQSCAGTTNASGLATCTIASVNQPGSATSAPVTVRFAGDDYYVASEAAATLKLLYYGGRAFGLSTKLLLGSPSHVADTGSISTSGPSVTRRSTASFTSLLAQVRSPLAVVTTGGGRSLAEASVAEATIAIAGVPLIKLSQVKASSQSTCAVPAFTAGSSGSTTATVTIGGILRASGAIAPNTKITAGLATIVLNEHKPVAGSSAGLLVNAARVTVPGVSEVVVSSAQSDVRNCP